jgi:4-oxalocrotonate tautomerase
VISREKPTVTASVSCGEIAKAGYLTAVFLHHESYADVDEVKGDAYGFGGLTQERRYIAGQLGVSPRRAL